MRTAEEHGQWIAGNETTVRYAMVDPILWSLGWSTWLPAQCVTGLDLRQRGVADYALFGPDGRLAILVKIETQPYRRSSDLHRLMTHVKGMSQGVAVLTCGARWEIYDLGLRAVKFADMMVERRILSPDTADEPCDIARALYRWMRRDLWWRSPR